jgi:signal transduction histidine kinase
MLRRLDTLFVRLFLLMWITLVASHFVAWSVAVPGGGPGDRPLPTLPSLPPGNPFADTGPGSGGPPPGLPPGPAGGFDGPPPRGPAPSSAQAPGLPAGALWTDYALRLLVIAFGAALGARWLAAPMRRLSRAAGALAGELARGTPLQPLDERRGTHEVRETAAVFNRMATRLQEQFDTRSLHMAALSHDLRTPLTRLRMRLEKLPEGSAPGAAADIREMDELIDGTLAVLREQRDGEAARTMDAAALLQAMVDDLAELGHEVALTAVPATRVRAHPAALRRIVGNLVGNALRHGGQACIALGTAEDGAVEILIDDDGPGIPPGQIEQAFRPWVRLPGSAARPGHGLGLAIARDLAERDGGRLSLHNRPEGGLRARLLLPPA